MAIARAEGHSAPPLLDSPTPGRRPPIGRCRIAVASLLSSLAATLLLAPPVGAQGSAAPPSLVLSPSKVRTETAAGLGVGPFGLTNQISTTYRVRVLPVLLGQDRAGGLLVRDDERALRQARRFLTPGTRSFRLPEGAQGSSTGTLRRLPPSKSFYGGLLFEANPQDDSDRQIVEILRLNASVLLDPPAAERRVSLGAEEMRAEQSGERGIRLLLPLTNRGNAYLPAGGSARVVDDGGQTHARVDLRRIEILPGATVDLRGRFASDLEPGTYELRGTATMEGESVRARGQMVIGADGKVEHRDASLLEAPAPTAYIGHPVDLSATYRNEGNVAFAPEAEVQVRPIVEGEIGEVEATEALEVAEAEPGESAELKGSVELPGEARAYQLEVVIADGERELDSRSLSVTPQVRPGLLTRVGTWIGRNALLLVLGLTALLAALAVGGLLYVRRLRASLGGTAAVSRSRIAVAFHRYARRLETRLGGGTTAPTARSEPPITRPHPGGDSATNFARAESATNGDSAGRGGTASAAGQPTKVSLADAGFEDLRALGMSTTQANRLLRYRDECGGFDSVDELDEVPGFPAELRARIKQSLVE